MPKRTAVPAYMALPGYAPATPEMIATFDRIAEGLRPKIEKAIKNRENAVATVRHIRLR